MVLILEVLARRSLALRALAGGARIVWGLDGPWLLGGMIAVVLGTAGESGAAGSASGHLRDALWAVGLLLLVWSVCEAVRRRVVHTYAVAAGGVLALDGTVGAAAALLVGGALMAILTAYESELWRRLDGTPLCAGDSAWLDADAEDATVWLMYCQAAVALVAGIAGVEVVRAWSGVWIEVATGVLLLAALFGLPLPVWPLGAGVPGLSGLHSLLVALALGGDRLKDPV
jgi:hypothetical protein